MNLIESFPGIPELRANYIQSELTFKKAMNLFISGMCTEISRTKDTFRFKVEDRFDDFTVVIDLSGMDILQDCSCNSDDRCCSHVAAALVYLSDLLEEEEEADGQSFEGETYTRDEMIRRVLKERRERAGKEDLQIFCGDNIYGFHRVKSAGGRNYNITIRDFKNSGGYCSCPDFKTNKLGTCKHLIFANDFIKEKFPVEKRIKKQPYPFVEIFCDPLNDYRITYFYSGQVEPGIDELLGKYFGEKDYILPEQYQPFIQFLVKAGEFKKILVRPEVEETIEGYFETEELKRLNQNLQPDFSGIKGELYGYQRQGILFSLFKKGSIIADEMGLGKTFQAICTAALKKEIFNFRRVLIVCPASLKYQWKSEIEKFSSLDAQIVEGPRDKRHEMYRDAGTYFLLTNYEAVLRDITVIKQHPPDMVILDEAQRIKNYDTKTSQAIKAIPKQHSLVLTGTPIENRLIDLYSIMNFIDPRYLAPLWEFSMEYCRFDKQKKNKINGYYNLQALKKRLDKKIIRRVKADVMEQLPEVQEITVPVQLTDEQMEIHAGYLRAVVPILMKKYKTVFDMQRIFQLLTGMRMVCDSTYLIDKETHISPKLEALKEILTEKLDIKRNRKKVIIFSEWKTMLRLIEKVLERFDIPYTKLTGDVPVKNRGKLIAEFMENPDCLVFLSTEAGGTGLNLQAADTVINFELPWNPAKKNQRIGRIHRIGQKSSSLTVINMISIGSIEERIAAGIELKESLFKAVLNEGVATDEVDFTKKGHSTMIQQVQKIVSPLVENQVEIPIDTGVEEEVFELPEFNEEAEQELALFDEEPVERLEMEKVPVGIEARSQAEKRNEPSPSAVKAGETGTGTDTNMNTDTDSDRVETRERVTRVPKPEEIESTLNQGLQFLNGIMSMSTGKQLVTEGQSITVNRETGEVVMKFKLPGF
ncbi:MAG: DEAD/DEAH box helicase [bacterium]|nr:DEAD/DEAH box helicase [bacterium]